MGTGLVLHGGIQLWQGFHCLILSPASVLTFSLQEEISLCDHCVCALRQASGGSSLQGVSVCVYEGRWTPQTLRQTLQSRDPSCVRMSLKMGLAMKMPKLRHANGLHLKLLKLSHTGNGLSEFVCRCQALASVYQSFDRLVEAVRAANEAGGRDVQKA